ncbi:hypothetical protein ABPG73_021561 [Tetrahymena malaccensis]
MKNDIPKLTDFGSGKYLGERNLEKFYIFTVSTASPQVLYGDLNKCSYKADIYSLGVLLYQMTNNLQLPNQYKSQNEIDYFHLRNQNQGIEKTLQFQSLTDERVQNLIFQMMQYKEDDRISIEELLENILMKDDIPKIINFAFGKFKSDTSLSIEKAYKYVPNLVAPEVLYKSTYTCSYKADIYSLGVLLYQMTNDLYYPYIFKSQSDIDYFHQYSQKYGIENTLKFKSLTNERVKNLIYQMMQYYEDDRISIQELVIQTQQIAYNQQEILFNLW